jgi:hypothetical protein
MAISELKTTLLRVSRTFEVEKMNFHVVCTVEIRLTPAVDFFKGFFSKAKKTDFRVLKGYNSFIPLKKLIFCILQVQNGRC